MFNKCYRKISDINYRMSNSQSFDHRKSWFLDAYRGTDNPTDERKNPRKRQQFWMSCTADARPVVVPIIVEAVGNVMTDDEAPHYETQRNLKVHFTNDVTFSSSFLLPLLTPLPKNVIIEFLQSGYNAAQHRHADSVTALFVGIVQRRGQKAFQRNRKNCPYGANNCRVVENGETEAKSDAELTRLLPPRHVQPVQIPYNKDHRVL